MRICQRQGMRAWSAWQGLSESREIQEFFLGRCQEPASNAWALALEYMQKNCEQGQLGYIGS